ncbi:DUF397 domain-containing protein [Streptomyces syringium]|uniref:DUF397 domain-containing protein n=1 Tax=Streptomyces syringium TaxID=76729 RepID=UPI003D8B594C
MKSIDIPGALWVKSSYSGGNEGECVEVARNLAFSTAWRKSSHSGNNGGACLEVADHIPGIVPVRDSKNPQGPVLVFPTTAWIAFIAGIYDRARPRAFHAH